MPDIKRVKVVGRNGIVLGYKDFPGNWTDERIQDFLRNDPQTRERFARANTQAGITSGFAEFGIPTKQGITPRNKPGIVPDPEGFIRKALQQEREQAESYTFLGSRPLGQVMQVLGKPFVALRGLQNAILLSDPNTMGLFGQRTDYGTSLPVVEDIRQAVAGLPVAERMAYSEGAGPLAYDPVQTIREEEAAASSFGGQVARGIQNFGSGLASLDMAAAMGAPALLGRSVQALSNLGLVGPRAVAAYQTARAAAHKGLLGYFGTQTAQHLYEATQSDTPVKDTTEALLNAAMLLGFSGLRPGMRKQQTQAAEQPTQPGQIQGQQPPQQIAGFRPPQPGPAQPQPPPPSSRPTPSGNPADFGFTSTDWMGDPSPWNSPPGANRAAGMKSGRMQATVHPDAQPPELRDAAHNVFIRVSELLDVRNVEEARRWVDAWLNYRDTWQAAQPTSSTAQQTQQAKTQTTTTAAPQPAAQAPQTTTQPPQQTAAQAQPAAAPMQPTSGPAPGTTMAAGQARTAAQPQQPQTRPTTGGSQIGRSPAIVEPNRPITGDFSRDFSMPGSAEPSYWAWTTPDGPPRTAGVADAGRLLFEVTPDANPPALREAASQVLQRALSHVREGEIGEAQRWVDAWMNYRDAWQNQQTPAGPPSPEPASPEGPAAAGGVPGFAAQPTQGPSEAAGGLSPVAAAEEEDQEWLQRHQQQEKAEFERLSDEEISDHIYANRHLRDYEIEITEARINDYKAQARALLELPKRKGKAVSLQNKAKADSLLQKAAELQRALDIHAIARRDEKIAGQLYREMKQLEEEIAAAKKRMAVQKYKPDITGQEMPEPYKTVDREPGRPWDYFLHTRTQRELNELIEDFKLRTHPLEMIVEFEAGEFDSKLTPQRLGSKRHPLEVYDRKHGIIWDFWAEDKEGLVGPDGNRLYRMALFVADGPNAGEFYSGVLATEETIQQIFYGIAQGHLTDLYLPWFIAHLRAQQRQDDASRLERVQLQEGSKNATGAEGRYGVKEFTPAGVGMGVPEYIPRRYGKYEVISFEKKKPKKQTPKKSFPGVFRLGDMKAGEVDIEQQSAAMRTPTGREFVDDVHDVKWILRDIKGRNADVRFELPDGIQSPRVTVQRLDVENVMNGVSDGNAGPLRRRYIANLVKQKGREEAEKWVSGWKEWRDYLADQAVLERARGANLTKQEIEQAVLPQDAAEPRAEMAGGGAGVPPAEPPPPGLSGTSAEEPGNGQLDLEQMFERMSEDQGGGLNVGLNTTQIVNLLKRLAAELPDVKTYIAEAAKRFGEWIKDFAEVVWDYVRGSAVSFISRRLELPGNALFDAIRNEAVEGMSALHRQARKTWVAAVRLATIWQQSSIESLFKTRSVLDKLADADAKQRYYSYIVMGRKFAHADNLNAILQSIQNERAALRAKRPTASPADVRKIDERLDYLDGYEKAVNDNLAGMRVDLDPVDGQPITRKRYLQYIRRPDVQQANDVVIAEVEPWLRANALEYGFDPNGITALETKVWLPAIRVNEQGTPQHVGRKKGGWSQPKAQVARYPGLDAFRGTADAYMTDLREALHNRAYHAMRAAAEARLWRTALKDGVALPIQNMQAGHVNFRGRMMPAAEVRLASLFRGKNFPRDLPNRVAVPSHLLRELSPLWEQLLGYEVTGALREVHNRGVMANLFGPADAVAHGFAILGRHGSIVPDWSLGGSKLGKLFNATYVSRTLRGIWDLFTVDYTQQQLEAALRVAARYGAIKPDFPETSQINFAGRALYGLGDTRAFGIPLGMHPRALTALYLYGKRAGWSDYQIGRAMQEYNVYSRPLQPTLQKSLQRAGLGVFYQTGMRNRLIGARYGYQLAITFATFMAYTALQTMTDPEGKPWFERPGQKPGEIMLGKDKDGRPVYWSGFNMLMRPIQYGQTPFRALATASILGGNANQQALSVGAETANMMMAPVFTGPMAGAIMAFSPNMPFVFPNERLTGYRFAENPAMTVEATSPERIAAVAARVMPIFVSVFGDPMEELRPKPIYDEDISQLSRYFRLVGAPAVRKGQYPSVAKAMTKVKPVRAGAMILRDRVIREAMKGE